jgi:hypothetical protein
MNLAETQNQSDSIPAMGTHGDKSEISVVCIGGHPPFARWLHSLEASDNLLHWEANTSQNVTWCKGVLARWKEAGYPDPESWPETRDHPCLHPSYRLNHAQWPDM